MSSIVSENPTNRQPQKLTPAQERVFDEMRHGAYLINRANHVTLFFPSCQKRQGHAVNIKIFDNLVTKGLIVSVKRISVFAEMWEIAQEAK